MVAQDMTDILAKEAFDALAKLLHAVDVLLIHLPFNVGRRRKRRDFSVYPVAPGHIGNEVLDNPKRFHPPDGNGFSQWQGIHSRPARQTPTAIDLRR